MDKQREDAEWNMLSKEEQEEKRKMDENLQRLKIEMLRKSSADISGRGSVGPTATSDIGSTKKGSTSRGSINGGRQSTDSGRTAPRSKSLISTKATQGTSASFSSISPAAAAATAASGAMPSSGSNSVSTKRGNLPLGLKPRPSSPGSSRKPPSVPSSLPSPVADVPAPSKPDQVPRRNSTSKRL